MKIISVTSGKGGAGKTVIAVNVAIALASLGKKVLLVDADLGLANVDIIMGLSCNHTLADVIDGKKNLEDVLITPFDGMTVLPASSGILKMERLSRDERFRLADQMQKLSTGFDLIIFDTGAGISENVIFFNSLADEVLLVTTPDPTAVTDTYALIKILSSQYDTKNFALIVNQVDTAAQALMIYEKFSAVCRNYLGMTIKYAGSLVKDGALEKAVRDRKPVLQSFPESAVSHGIRTFAARFEEVFVAAPRNLQGGIWKTWVSQWPEQRKNR
jgi:flagellar biosynthesis protein FlhG